MTLPDLERSGASSDAEQVMPAPFASEEANYTEKIKLLSLTSADSGAIGDMNARLFVELNPFEGIIGN